MVEDATLRLLAWHDVTCPEGPECRDRRLHSISDVLANTGVLDRFLARLEELEQIELVAIDPA